MKCWPTRPLLLDLFCGAGGAAMGYHRAGFDVLGVDIKFQPRYPFRFVQAEALRFLERHGQRFDAIHASPPCQAYCSICRVNPKREYPDLVAPTRARLIATGRPYVIENVEGAPLHHPILLCGSSFGTPLKRHRLFESSVFLWGNACRHGAWPLVFPNPDYRLKNKARFVAVYGGPRYAGDDAVRRKAMGIDWMTRQELTQAVPPAYTEYLGRQLIAQLQEVGS
jgi:DNA (cytosine-5)-methyltransferase 1